jgi:hypothetical protein
MNQTFVAPSYLLKISTKFVKVKMFHKQIILEYCGDLFVYLFTFGGVFFVVADSIMNWTCHGRGVGLTILSRLGMAIKKIVSVFFLMT